MVGRQLTTLVCAHNITQSTTNATVTKTVFHTVTTSINLATLPGSASYGPASSSATTSDAVPSFELKSVYVQTIELTSTIFSTEVNGVVITSLSTVVMPVTSTATTVLTDFEEVTSTSTKQISTTITTTSMVVSVTTPSAAAPSTSIEQQIAGMWGMSGGERLGIGKWLASTLVVLSFVHYLFFAH